MKNITKMKNIINLFILLTAITSCEKENLCQNENWGVLEFFEQESENVLAIEYNYADINEVEDYLNNYYFNKVDIQIDLKKECSECLNIIIDNSITSAGNYTENKKEIRIKVDRVFTDVMPHEIGHYLGLSHKQAPDYKNIMFPVHDNCFPRLHFSDEQANNMLVNLKSKNEKLKIKNEKLK